MPGLPKATVPAVIRELGLTSRLHFLSHASTPAISTKVV